MNERIRLFAEQARVSVITTKGMEGVVDGCYIVSPDQLAKFAQLIVAECSRLNKAESYELSGVIADVEADNGFDELCLNTVKRVHQYLSSDALEQQFGVDE